MELTINGTTYPLKASLAFLNEIEKTKYMNREGQDIEFGLANAVIMMQQMSDARSLEQVLLALNTKQTPRLDKKVLDAWLEEGDADIEELIGQVIDFLSKANVCKGKLKRLLGTQMANVKA